MLDKGWVYKVAGHCGAKQGRNPSTEPTPSDSVFIIATFGEATLNNPISIELTRVSGYRFVIDYGPDFAGLISDEPEPLGAGVGPGPQHLLLSAVANCLSASLTFALSKFKQDPGRLSAKATAVTGRNAENRLRIERIDVSIHLDKPAAELEHLERVLEQFESFCTVSMSVREGIAIHAQVVDNTGAVLKG